MQIDIISIFPEIFESVFDIGMTRLAREKGLLTITVHDLRDWTEDRHRQVDDIPYGGGPGMVMKPEPFSRALNDVLGHDPLLLQPGERTVLLTPQGERLSQRRTAGLAGADKLVLLCGRYEGVDERVRSLISDEVSLGDFVLSGGEIAAMALTDAIGRLIPGVLGEAASLDEESFAVGGLEYPQYTRPAVFGGESVPEILLSGDHGGIATWREEQARLRTLARRPDLL